MPIGKGTAKTMRRFKMLVFSEPFVGQDEEFNQWYSGQHGRPGGLGLQKRLKHRHETIL